MDTDKPDFISTDATALENGKSSARVVQWAVCEKNPIVIVCQRTIKWL